MEFILDRIVPALGTTLIGIVIVIFLIFIVMVVTILLTIKDYKNVKENLKELNSDIKKILVGKENRKNRKLLLLGVLFIFISLLTISAIMVENDKPKQLIILTPANNEVYDIQDDIIIKWKPVSGTWMYSISVYPIGNTMYTSDETCNFYVDSDVSVVRIELRSCVSKTGNYVIAISSDVDGSKADRITIQLINREED